MTPDDAWNRPRPAPAPFDGAALGELPDAARRYLEHAIAPGTPLASAARFAMRGDIRLGRWRSFEAEEAIDADGRLRTIALDRWGEPERKGFRRERFGGVMLREATFDGYTIPAEARVGWYFGSARFETDGAFFCARIERYEIR